MKKIFETIENAIKDISNGKMVIVVDDEDRENEGDLVCAAHFVTPDTINFMIQHGKGLVCVPVTDAVLERLEIKDMVNAGVDKHDKYKTAFTISIDASTDHGITTGISASDRAKTIRVFVDPNSTPKDILTPGHIFPLRARQMGVLRRAGHTEAAVDLARMAGLSPAGVICEIIKDDGEMARGPDLIKFAKKHKLKMITIKDLIQYRITKERFITKVETTKLPTDFGDFELTCYEDRLNEKTHVVLTKGDPRSKKSVLTRIHSECLTGDVFNSCRCDCGRQLEASMRMIEKEGCGAILYMRQEGRGIGLANKIKAYKLQDNGADTVDANLELGFPSDLRDYGVGAQILLDLGITRLNLITNNPQKIVGLEGYGITINKRIPLIVEPNPHNKKYLEAKAKRMGHVLD